MSVDVNTNFQNPRIFFKTATRLDFFEDERQICLLSEMGSGRMDIKIVILVATLFTIALPSLPEIAQENMSTPQSILSGSTEVIDASHSVEISQEKYEYMLFLCGERRVGWIGTTIEKKRFGSIPIPASFQKFWQKHKASCQFLDTFSFLEQHLKFGTEKSTAVALDWLANAIIADGHDVPRDADPALLQSLADASPGIDTRRDMREIEPLRTLAIVATQYLRAAEFFHSREFLERAKPYIAAADLAAVAYIETRAKPDPDAGQIVDLQYDMDVNVFTLRRELHIRYGVELAYQTEHSEDILAAQALLDRGPDNARMLKFAADLAAGAPQSLCSGLSAKQSPACDPKNDNFHDKSAISGDTEAVWHWRDQAKLDLAKIRQAWPKNAQIALINGISTLDLALTFLRENLPMSDEPLVKRGDRATDELVQLYLEAAETVIACSRTERQLAFCSPDRAREYLASAKLLVSGSVDPNRFRQISSGYARSYRTQN